MVLPTAGWKLPRAVASSNSALALSASLEGSQAEAGDQLEAAPGTTTAIFVTILEGI